MTKEKTPYDAEKDEIIKLKKKNPKKALSLATQLRKKTRADKDELQTAIADFYIAECEFNLNHYQKCIDIYSRILNIFKKYNRRDALEHAYNLMGICYMVLGDNQKALSKYLTGLKYCTNERYRLITQSNIGILYFNLCCYEEAYKYFNRVYKKTIKYYHVENGEYRKKSGMISLFAVLINMADVLGSLERFEESQTYLDMIEQYAEVFPEVKEDKETDEVLFLNCRVKTYFGLLQFDEAMKQVSRIIELVETNDLDADSFQDMKYIIQLLIRYRYLRESKFLLDKMLENAERINSTSFFVDYYACAVDYYKAEQNIAKLIESYDGYFRYAKMKEEADNQSFVRGIHTKISLETALEKQRKSEEKAKKLKLLSETDALTGVLNRFSMNKLCDDLFTKAKNEQTNLGLILFDVDCFKEYNDTYGHVAGDECLKAVSKVLYAFHDADHFIARYGGDEFLMMVYGQTNEHMMKIAEEIRKNIEKLHLEHKNSKNPSKIASLTIGVSNYIPCMDETVLDHIQKADEALYDAKRKERGSIVYRLG